MEGKIPIKSFTPLIYFLANGDTIEGGTGRWPTPPPLHFTVNRRCIKNMCVESDLTCV